MRSLAFALLLILAPAIALAQAGERFRADPRAPLAPPPADLDQAIERFAPGWDIVLPPTEVRVSSARGHAATIETVAGACYRVLLWGPDATADLDVDVREDGGLVARHDEPEPWADAPWCASRTGPAVVLVRTIHPDAAGRFVVLRDPTTAARVAGPGDELENRLLALQRETAPRAAPAASTWRLRARGPEIRELQMPVRAGVCYTWLAVGSSTVEDVDLRLQALDGAPLDTDIDPSAVAAVAWCADRDTRVRISLALTRGHGHVAILPLRLPP